MSPVKERFIEEEGIALGYDEPYGRAERVRQLHVSAHLLLFQSATSSSATAQKRIRGLVEEMLPFENMRWDRMLAKDTDRAREAMERRCPEVCRLSREQRDTLIRNNWRYCQRRKKQAKKSQDPSRVESGDVPASSRPVSSASNNVSELESVSGIAEGSVTDRNFGQQVEKGEA